MSKFNIGEEVVFKKEGKPAKGKIVAINYIVEDDHHKRFERVETNLSKNDKKEKKKPLYNFKVGEAVMIQVGACKDTHWYPGIIDKVFTNPFEYLVHTAEADYCTNSNTNMIPYDPYFKVDELTPKGLVDDIIFNERGRFYSIGNELFSESQLILAL